MSYRWYFPVLGCPPGEILLSRPGVELLELVKGDGGSPVRTVDVEVLDLSADFWERRPNRMGRRAVPRR